MIPVWLRAFEVIGYITTTICVALSIAGNKRLYDIREEMFIRKRFIPLLFCLNATMTVQMIILEIAVMAELHGYTTLKNLSVSIVIWCWWFLLFFWNTKSWLIYYKEKWTEYTFKLQWQTIINDKDKHVNDNWFIRNHYKYGNTRYMIKVFGVMHCSGVSLSIFGEVNNLLLHLSLGALINTILTYCFFLLPLAIFIAIICKTTRSRLIDDIFSVHWEAKMHSILLLLYIMIQFLIYQPMVFISGSFTVCLTVFTPLFIVHTYLIIYVSTFGIYSRNYIQSNDKSLLHDTHAGDIDKKETITLRDILSNQESLHLFMSHLSKEFSMELLLSYIEITQYEQYLQKIADISDDLHLNDVPILSSDVPISCILMDRSDSDKRDDVSEAKGKGYRLYNKYIKNGCEFEVNIGYALRTSFAMFDDLNALLKDETIHLKEIFALFHEVRTEMNILLTFSLSRFRLHEKWAKVVNLHSKHESEMIVVSCSDTAPTLHLSHQN